MLPPIHCAGKFGDVAKGEKVQENWIRLSGDLPLLNVSDAPSSAALVRPLEDLLIEAIERKTRKYRLALDLLDRRALRWLEQTMSPYRDELRQMCSRLNRPGVAMFNLAQEWACTTLAFENDCRPILVRVFDWDLDGLGEGLVALSRCTRRESLSLTWPYYIGDLTVLSPGRFAAAINQAPFKRRSIAGVTFPTWLDWMADLRETCNSRAMPPSHLLRHVSDTAGDFDEALELLTRLPICRPAIFVLTGISPGQTAVVERRPAEARVRRSKACAANHWATHGWPEMGRDDSRDRAAALPDLVGGSFLGDFKWLLPPVLNERTRYAAILNASISEAIVERIEHEQPIGETSVVARRPTSPF